MKIFEAFALLALVVGNTAALPRGAGSAGSIRAAGERKLGMDDMGGGGGGGGGDAGEAVQGDGIVEIHSCEPDPAVAIAYVDTNGATFQAEDGDAGCYADPVNGCPGGCCRFGTYFICDTGNFAPHLACVCNSNTAPVPISTPQPTLPPTTPAPTTGAPTTPMPTTTIPTTPVPVPVTPMPTDATATTLPAPLTPVPVPVTPMPTTNMTDFNMTMPGNATVGTDVAISRGAPDLFD